MNKLIAILGAFAVFGSFTFVTSEVQAAKPDKYTIVDKVLEDDGEFDVLQAAVVRAGLVDALNGNRQFTVFAPTDAAFISTLGATDEADAISIIESLPVEDLTDILLFHVTPGNRVSESVLGAPQYRMLNGDKLQRADLLSAGIASVDNRVDNGTIHIINSVLMP